MNIFEDTCYIIQHRDQSSNKDRTRNLIQVLKHLRRISNNLSILIIEQAEQKEEEFIKLISQFNVEYEFIYNPGLFNRSWGFNFASSITDKNKLIFADNDLIVDDDCVIAGVEMLDNYSVVRPYNGYSNDLNEEQTRYFSLTNIKSVGIMRNIHNISGGVVMFQKKAFNDIGMFDERFEGWGGEDDEMMLNIKNCCEKGIINVASLNKPVTHLFHTRANTNDGITQPNYNKNVSYINDGMRNNGIAVLGDRNKYAKN